MRVVLFDQALDGHHLEYATWLATSLHEAGDEVSFVTLRPPEWETDLGPLTNVASVRYLTPRPGIRERGRVSRLWELNRAARVAVKLAERRRAHVLHYLYLDHAELPFRFASPIGRHPFANFGSLWWPYFTLANRQQRSLLGRWYHKLVQRSVGSMLRRGALQGLFVHSERSAGLLTEAWGDAVRPRIHVVPDPSTRQDGIGMEASRERLRLPPGGRLILFFGGLRYDKGPDLFLEALRGLRGDWSAVMAGTPGWLTEEQALEHRGRLEHPERLILRLGYVSDADVPRYFEAADVVVLPYREAFLGTSGVLNRAAAAGRPVIATDVGDVGTIVRTAGLGRTIRQEDPDLLRASLQSFIDSPEELAEEVREAAARYAASVDWHVLGALVRDVYLSSLRERGLRPGD